MLPTILLHRGRSTKLLRERMPRKVHLSVCRNPTVKVSNSNIFKRQMTLFLKLQALLMTNYTSNSEQEAWELIF